MALKNGNPNPLNVLNLRRVYFPAHHFYFSNINITKTNSLKLLNSIDEWIYNNLNGRYYIGTSIDLIDNQFVLVTRVGFEQEKELSFFKLVCPYLH